MDEDDADFSELRKACMRGDVDTVDRILDQAGAEKNRMICDSTNDNGLSLLHCATNYNHPTIVATLIRHGADPNAQGSKTGGTALDIASRLQHTCDADVLRGSVQVLWAPSVHRLFHPSQSPAIMTILLLELRYRRNPATGILPQLPKVGGWFQVLAMTYTATDTLAEPITSRFAYNRHIGADDTHTVAYDTPDISASSTPPGSNTPPHGIPYQPAVRSYLCPAQKIGFVIGKQGSTVKELVALGANVSIQPEAESTIPGFRRITLSGDHDAMGHIERKINQILNGSLQAIDPPKLINKVEPKAAPTSETMEVPVEKVGWLIGAKGSTRRNIQERSGATVDIPRSAAENGQPIVIITLSGTIEQIACARGMISEILSGGTNAVPTESVGEDTVRQLVKWPTNKVGVLIGARGSTIKDLQVETGCHIVIPPDPVPGTEIREITIVGSQSQVNNCIMKMSRLGEVGALALADIAAFVSASLASEKSAAVSGPVGSLNRPVVQPRSNTGSTSDIPTVLRRVLECPNQHVGRLIGKGGAAFRKLQDDSGCQITIPSASTTGVAFREVTLTGTASQISKAEDLINHVIVAGGGVNGGITQAPIKSGLPPPLSSSLVSISSSSSGSSVRTSTPRTLSIQQATLTTRLLDNTHPSWDSPGMVVGEGSAVGPAVVVIQVPAEKLGKVIGKGGAKIKELSQLCIVEIQPDSTVAPGDMFRDVTLRGDTSQIQRCERLILGLISAGLPPAVAQTRPGGTGDTGQDDRAPVSLRVKYPTAIVGHLTAYNGFLLNTIIYESGCHISVVPCSPHDLYQELVLSGLQSQIRSCRKMINERATSPTRAVTPGIGPAQQQQHPGVPYAPAGGGYCAPSQGHNDFSNGPSKPPVTYPMAAPQGYSRLLSSSGSTPGLQNIAMQASVSGYNCSTASPYSVHTGAQVGTTPVSTGNINQTAVAHVQGSGRQGYNVQSTAYQQYYTQQTYSRGSAPPASVGPYGEPYSTFSK